MLSLIRYKSSWEARLSTKHNEHFELDAGDGDLDGHHSELRRFWVTAILHLQLPQNDPYKLTINSSQLLGEISSHRNPEFYPTTELNMVVRLAEKQIPPVPHWRFCYTILRKVFVYGAFLIHRLDPVLRNAVCVLCLVQHALDTVEDDTSIATEVKIPIMMAFHRHIYDPEWHFACGRKNYRVLMDKFHHVSTAFLELGSSYQEVIEDVTKTSGAGMAKFIFKEVETIDDYNEYCHYAAGIVGLGFAKLIHLSGIEDLPPDTFFHSVSIFAQKADVIQDYLEDINEIPKARMFWPRQIWSKSVDKLEDFKYEKNSVKAVYCLNEMVTNALIHAEDCLKNISAVQNPAIFQSCAMTQKLRATIIFKSLEMLRK